MILSSDELSCASCRQTPVLYRPGRDQLMIAAFSVNLGKLCIMMIPDARTSYLLPVRLNLGAEPCIMPDMCPLAAAVSA